MHMSDPRDPRLVQRGPSPALHTQVGITPSSEPAMNEELPTASAPPGYLIGLGKLVANFQSVEIAIALIVWGLIAEEQQVGRIITSQLSFSKLLDVGSSLLRYRVGDDHEVVAELEGLLRRASEVEQKRNRLTHSAWAVGDDGEEVVRLKWTARRGQGLRQQEGSVAVDELKDAVSQMRDLVGDLVRFATRLGEAGVAAIPMDLGRDDGGES
jgi:hypothetical protein